MEFIKNNFKIITIVGCLIAILGCFLPLVIVSAYTVSQSINYVRGTGLIVIALLVVSIILVLLKKEKFSIISIGLATAVFLYEIINLNNRVVSLFSGLVKFNYGVGFYLIIVGLVVALATSILKVIKK